MLRPGGFPEYTPGVQQIFDTIKHIIKKSYEQFGYVSIWTPAVEKNSVLCKGSESTVKQIFGLYGLAQGASDLKDYSLHFDLTVPFARYVLDHESELTFPFKRSQIQPVWRGERRQRGRFNEFWQADIDVIWPYRQKEVSKSKDDIFHLVGDLLWYDAEVLHVLATTVGRVLDHFAITKPLIVKVNNRKVVEGFFGKVCPQKKQEIIALVDDYYKLSTDVFYAELGKIVGDDFTLEKVKTFFMVFLDYPEVFHWSFGEIESFFTQKLGQDIFSDDTGATFYAGVKELSCVFTNLRLLAKENAQLFTYDPFIVRGLDYYTGTVFETYFLDDMTLGSVCSGGRYEGLTQTINPGGTRYDGVGGSIGLSRLCTLLLEEKLVSPMKETSTEYLFVHFSDTLKEAVDLMKFFLQQGKACELYPFPEKVAKQLAYAHKKGIPHVVLLGSNEVKSRTYVLKNMHTGEEVSHSLPR